MKKKTFLTVLLLIFAAEITALILFAFQDTSNMQDAVLVNEAVRSVQADWKTIKDHKNQTSLDYVVLAMDGSVLYKTRSGLNESINAAVIHRDTILDIEIDNVVAGRILIYNDNSQFFQSKKQIMITVLSFAMLLQCILCFGYIIYLNHTIMKPFQKLKGFAERVAGGNLDIPLEMDRQNVFGAFTESFDIMRSELKRARKAEAVANASKKELVAKLSHDIKTPVASIKAASEVGAALTDDKKIRDNYTQIIRKADQINALITNLFTATLEDLQQLSVTPEDIESGELKNLLENSDYLHRAEMPDIPDCILCADRLRLQQVFDNIFANSYKYADTKIDVTVYRDGESLVFSIEDYGGGVATEELPLLKEKFKRGSNAKNVEGAGLGLYISDYFMQKMHGGLLIENGRKGLKVSVVISQGNVI